MAKDRILVGFIVSAAVGLLIDGAPGENNKQQKQSWFTGTVLCSAENQGWMVFWHDIQKACDHAPSILKIESSTGDLLSIESLNVEAILKDSYVRNINNFLAIWRPAPVPQPCPTAAQQQDSTPTNLVSQQDH